MVIGFIGLGIMGKPMAKNLCKAGYSLIVNDHHIENINELEECGAESGTLEYIAKNSDVVITMLPNSPQVKEVILGENGVARYMKSGTCFIDMSSINPVDSRYIGKILKEKEIEMLDAPVSGGEPKAIDGTVAFMVGGDENTFEKYKEILKNNNYILSSANSINIGRLLPQIVYYFYSYFDLVKNKHIKLKDKINFTVPTGNFGNILAAYYAKLMGLPVNKLICASNDNNVLYDFFNSGIYNKNRELILTSSPSMDILISSNLERLLFEISSRDSEKVNNLIKDLNNKGLYKLDTNMKKNLNSFRSEYANELEVKRNINKVFKEYNYLIDTHTCVAYTSYMKYLKKHKDCTPTVIVSTASPYKFSKDVLYSLGEEVNNFDKFEIIEKLSKFSHTEIPYPIKKLKTSLILHDENCEKDEIKSEIKKILKM